MKSRIAVLIALFAAARRSVNVISIVNGGFMSLQTGRYQYSTIVRQLSSD